MAYRRYSYRILINTSDPAREQIAEDLTAHEGQPVPEEVLTYRFGSSQARDEALKQIRGSFGSRSVEAVDLILAPASAATRAPGKGANALTIGAHRN